MEVPFGWVGRGEALGLDYMQSVLWALDSWGPAFQLNPTGRFSGTWRRSLGS